MSNSNKVTPKQLAILIVGPLLILFLAGKQFGIFDELTTSNKPEVTQNVVKIPAPKTVSADEYRATNSFEIDTPITFTKLEEKLISLRENQINTKIEEEKYKQFEAKKRPVESTDNPTSSSPRNRNGFSNDFMQETPVQNVSGKITNKPNISEYELAVAAQLSDSIQMISVGESYYRSYPGLTVGDFTVISSSLSGIKIRSKSGKQRVLAAQYQQILPTGYEISTAKETDEDDQQSFMPGDDLPAEIP